MMHVGEYHEYTGGCSVHQRDTMMHVGGYHEYIGGCSVHRRDTMMHVGDIKSTVGDVQYIAVFIYQRFLSTCSPRYPPVSDVLNILNVLMIFPT